MPDSSVAVTAGAGTAIDTFTVPGGDHRQVVIIGDRGGFSGRVGTFRTPGRAGTTGQRLFTIHNASGSTVQAGVDRISVDVAFTAAKAVTVLPPIIRVSRITALPSGGTAGTVAPDDTSLASSASVTVLQDASADGTSGTALAATAVSTVTQQYAARLITAAGYEPAGRVELLSSGPVVLRPLEGLVVELVYTLATQNPVTDMWIVTVHWAEWTP